MIVFESNVNQMEKRETKNNREYEKRLLITTVSKITRLLVIILHL